MQLPVAELALQMLDDIERGQTWDWGFWMYIQKNAYGGQGREDVDPYLDKWVYVTDERLVESAFVGDGRRLDRMYITDQGRKALRRFRESGDSEGCAFCRPQGSSRP